MMTERMVSLTERLIPIHEEFLKEDERHRKRMDELRAEQERVTADYYRERKAITNKNFSLIVKLLKIELSTDVRIVSVTKSRKPFEIVIEKVGSLKHADLLSKVKRHTNLKWTTLKSGIPNVCMLSLSEKEITKLQPK